MNKYKVLLPTNGLEVGTVVELTDEQANSFNAGEPTPRVELIEGEIKVAVVEAPVVEAPKEPVIEEPKPEAPVEATTTPAEEAKAPEAPDAQSGAPAETNV